MFKALRTSEALNKYLSLSLLLLFIITIITLLLYSIQHCDHYTRTAGITVG